VKFYGYSRFQYHEERSSTTPIPPSKNLTSLSRYFHIDFNYACSVITLGMIGENKAEEENLEQHIERTNSCESSTKWFSTLSISSL